MDISSISNIATTYSKNTTSGTSSSKTSSTVNQADTSGVVYEKSSAKDYKTNNSALIQQMKQDTADRLASLTGIVEKMMSKQGVAIAKSDDIWSFLAGGKFTIDEAAKKKAQEEISENGYWGVKQTSDRIVDFAKALSGDDSSKADQLLDAFKKGFKQATKSWGKDLPDISQKTYDAVVDKFTKWKNGEETSTTETEA